ncbi:hypothetical protein [Psychromonas aquimarina]|uniref:hypothetical protein n=1 Tax=Psychromonas aquimarina TaxID=444919 RepID=UPI00048BC4DD|nr:hypothetical protein [Psychromonas aquimarina]
MNEMTFFIGLLNSEVDYKSYGQRCKMIALYEFDINTSTNNYLSLQFKPLVRVAQLTSDLAMLVGEKVVNPHNQGIASVLKDISDSIEHNRSYFEHLDCKENEIRKIFKDYVEAVYDESINRSLYDHLIEALETHRELFDQ